MFFPVDFGKMLKTQHTMKAQEYIVITHSSVCAMFPWFENMNQYIDTTAVPSGKAVPDVTSLAWCDFDSWGCASRGCDFTPPDVA